MKQYKGYEVTAINTNGFWYGYASKDGKAVFSDKRGFNDRDVAIGVTEAHVSLLIEDETAGRCIHLDDVRDEDYFSSLLYGVDNNNCESREGD